MSRREILLKLFPEGHTKYSLSNDEDIKDVICREAYKDIKRNLHNIGAADQEKQEVFEMINISITEYFNKPAIKNQGEYDKWHRKICDSIINKLKSVITNDMTYGKAQKLLNMTMKHLYCFSDANEEYFKYCHIPVDSNVIWWYNKYSGNSFKTEWTKMKKENYTDFQNNMRDFLESENNNILRYENEPFTLLESDFVIWKMKDLIYACDLFEKSYNNLNEFKDWQMFKGSEVDENIKKVYGCSKILSCNIDRN